MSKIILILLLLSGCGHYQSLWSNSAYSRSLQSYIGQSEINLYEKWGSPDDVLNISPGNKVVSYTDYYSSALGGQTQAYSNNFNYSAMNAGLMSQNTNNYYCTTSFTIQDGIVTNYSFNGDDCVAR